MLHNLSVNLQWLLLLLPFLYVNAPRTWIPGELVTSGMMNSLRDLFLEIEAGTADYQKLNIVGRTSAALASDLSVAGKAKVAYDTTQGSLVASINGAAYGSLGGGSGSFDPFNPLFIAWGID